MTTEKQKNAIRFCEEWLGISFGGNVCNFNDVNKFLNENLDEAKSVAENAQESYFNNIND